MNKISKYLFLLIFLISPLLADASIVRNSAEINLGDKETFSENTYLIATKNIVSSVFEKDIFLTGLENNFSGKVEGDLFIMGGNNVVSGEVMGDLRIVGGEVLLNGKVHGDLLIFGGKVTIGENAQILGQSIFLSGQFFQNAPLHKSAKIISGTVSLNSEIKEPAEITAQKIKADSKSKILSTLTYYSPKEIEKIAGSEISGQLAYNQIANFTNTNIIKRTLINLMNFWILLKFITTLIIALILVFVFRVFSQKTVDLAINSYAKSFVIGFVASIFVPLFILILMISLIGLPIGLLVLLAYLILGSFAIALSGIMVGAIIRKMFFKQETFKVDFNSAVLGVVVLTFIGFVPFAGTFTRVIFDLLALGALMRQIKINLFN